MGSTVEAGLICLADPCHPAGTELREMARGPRPNRSRPAQSRRLPAGHGLWRAAPTPFNKFLCRAGRT